MMRMLRAIPLLLAVGGTLGLTYVSWEVSSHSAHGRYKACTLLAASDPQKALALAQEWSTKTPLSPFAQHCEALALYGTKHYAQAAQKLLALSQLSAAHNPNLSLNISLQAARAFAMAKQYDRAEQTLSDLLTLSKLSSDSRSLVLIERARTHRDMQEPLMAIQDLDDALNAAPDRSTLLVERARTYLALRQPKLALEDLQQALALEPKNPDATAMLIEIDSKNKP